MRKGERKRIIKAIDYFLDDDPDKWQDGINELFLLAYGVKWSKRFEQLKLKPMSVYDIFREMKDNEKND